MDQPASNFLLAGFCYFALSRGTIVPQSKRVLSCDLRFYSVRREWITAWACLMKSPHTGPRERYYQRKTRVELRVLRGENVLSPFY